MRASLLNCRRLVLCYIDKSCLQISWMDSWVYLWKGLHESRSRWSIVCCWSWHWPCNGMWHVPLEFIKTINETGICLYRYDIYRSCCTLFAFLYAPHFLVVMVCFSKIMQCSILLVSMIDTKQVSETLIWLADTLLAMFARFKPY